MARNFGLFMRLMREHENIWCKVSCPERLRAAGPPAFEDVIPFARRMVEQFPDRVLWGTDWPHPNLKNHMPDDGLLVDYIPRIALTDDSRHRLLVANPMRLYRLELKRNSMALHKPYADIPGTRHLILENEQVKVILAGAGALVDKASDAIKLIDNIEVVSLVDRDIEGDLFRR